MICPAFVATLMSLIDVSSVSPDLCDTTHRYFFDPRQDALALNRAPNHNGIGQGKTSMAVEVGYIADLARLVRPLLLKHSSEGERGRPPLRFEMPLGEETRKSGNNAGR